MRAYNPAVALLNPPAMNSGDTIGAYRVHGKLGAGGMGEVYRASDSKLKRDVALKVLPAAVASDPDRLARFQREAELLASLNHPNIAHVYGLEESGGTAALVMELVDGDDLSWRIARGAMPIHDVLAIAQQIAGALEAAHDRGIIHRDLKPSNVRVRPDGCVKVLDFGLAKAVSSGGANLATVTALSSAGTIIGTPAYMSPEQARGEATGPETDIWAFGVVLFEMLTGVSPFGRPSSAETLSQVLTATADESLLSPAIPAGIRRLIRRCLEKDPRRRWRHLGDARIEIEEALAGPAGADRSAAAAANPAAMSRRQALRYGAAAVALAGAGAAGAVMLDRRLRHAAAPHFRRLTFRRGLIRSARVAPDGQTVYYGALWDGDSCRVHGGRLDSPESSPLELPAANVLAVSRTGELAISLGAQALGIITSGTLARVPIGGGAPRPIVEDAKFADWSRDGANLAIVRRVDGRDRLEYPIGNVLVAGSEKGLGFLRVAPDGRSVAFVEYRDSGQLFGRVAIVDQAGTVTGLSPEYLNIHGLTWRGTEIVYTAAEDRSFLRALHVLAPGAAPRTLARTPGNMTVWDALPDGRLVIAQTDDRSVTSVRLHGATDDRELSWLDATLLAGLSRDGRQVLFTEIGMGGGPEWSAYLRGTDGSPAVRLGVGRALALSPDARWAISIRATRPSPYLELLPTGAGESRRIQDGLGYFSARWLPDGQRIVVSAAEPGQRPRLFIRDLGSGRPTPITPDGVSPSSWVISPEGTTLAVRASGSGIMLYDLRGSGAPPREVPGLSGAEEPVGWIPDGLLVMRPGAPPLGEILKVDVATGKQAPWANVLPRDRAGLMGLTAIDVSPNGQSLAYSWHRALSNLYLADGFV